MSELIGTGYVIYKIFVQNYICGITSVNAWFKFIVSGQEVIKENKI